MKRPIVKMMKLPVGSSFGRVRPFSINRSAVSSERMRNRHGCTLCGDGAYLAVSSSVFHTSIPAHSLADITLRCPLKVFKGYFAVRNEEALLTQFAIAPHYSPCRAL